MVEDVPFHGQVEDRGIVFFSSVGDSIYLQITACSLELLQERQKGIVDRICGLHLSKSLFDFRKRIIGNPFLGVQSTLVG